MKRIGIIALAAALALAAAPGMAKDRSGHGCPPGLAKKSPACVPPGLAKKGVSAREWEHRDDDDGREARRDDDHDGYRRGDRLPADRYVILETGDRVIFEGREYIVIQTDHGTVLRRGDDWYRLPRIDDGSEYVRVGDSILKVDRKTKAFIEMIRLADLIVG